MFHHPIGRLLFAARSGALLALAIALPAAAARAGELHQHLTGSVTNIIDLQQIGDELAAHGVSLGAEVSIDFSIEPTTPGMSIGETTIYFGAVLSLSIQIGSYEAHATALPNSVMVDDNPVADGWSLSAQGVDTDEILGPSSLSVFFNDLDGSTLSNENLIQDLGDFPIGGASIGSGNGFIFIDIEVGSGGGPGSGGSALARKGQILAAKNLGRAVLAAERKHAAAPPEKDPFGDKKNQAIDKAKDNFLVQFVKAIDKAVKKGGTAPLPADAKEEAATSILEGCDALVLALLTGANPDSKNDRTLRAKLIGAASDQLTANLAAHAKNLMKPNPVKLGEKLAKSRAKLIAAVGKAIEKALDRGIVYTGPSAAEIADMVVGIVDGFVELTLGAG